MTQFAGKVVAVTGAGQGIGAALVDAFAESGAAEIAAIDRNAEAVKTVASRPRVTPHTVDVADELALADTLSDIRRAHGRLDVLCSNAGILELDQPFTEPVSAGNDVWQRVWEVNVMSHVYGARAVLPGMLERGEGYLLNTASAAGLLSQIGSATYSVSKHAAIGFAESLSIAYGDRGVQVSVLCPQGVDTPMLHAHDGERISGLDGILTPREVADAALEGLRDRRFLILPHARVATYMQRKVGDYDRWLRGMRKLRDQIAVDRQP